LALERGDILLSFSHIDWNAHVIIYKVG
jgi:hypothetical protein